MQSNQWDPVTWNKTGQKVKGVSKASQINRAMRTGNVETSRKYGAGGNQQGGAILNTKTLDEDMDTLKHETVSLELKKLLMQERMKAELSQKDLATTCNVKPQVIQDYEAGRGIPNPQMLTKIERAIKQKNPEFVIGTLTKAQKAAKQKEAT